MASDEIKIGDIAEFVAYAEIEEGFDIFTEGERLEVTDVQQDGNIVCVSINENNERLDADGEVISGNAQPKAGMVWPTEIKVIEPVDGATEEAPEEQAETAPAETAPAEAAPEQPAATDPSKMSGKQLDEFVSVNGVETPAGWGKMKVGDKRDFVSNWLAEQESGEDVTAEPEPVETAPAEPAPVEQPEEQPNYGMVPRADAKSVQEALAAQDAISAAHALIRQEGQTQYTLGGVLRNINETGIYKTLGYEGKKGFEEFCQQHLGVEYRKARYLIKTYEAFRRINIDEERLEKLGWSKAKELARIAPEQLEEDADALLDYAENHTRDDVIAHIKDKYEVASRANSVKTTTFSFKLVEEEAEGVKAALDHAKQRQNEDDPNKAFAYICNDWMNNAEGTDLDLDQFAALALARFGREAVDQALTRATESEGEEQGGTLADEEQEA